MRNFHLQFVLSFFAGWVNRNQQSVIEYPKTENQVYREQLRGKRIRFTDDQRRRLAAKAKLLGSVSLITRGAALLLAAYKPKRDKEMVRRTRVS